MKRAIDTTPEVAADLEQQRKTAAAKKRERQKARAERARRLFDKWSKAEQKAHRRVKKYEATVRYYIRLGL